MATALAVISVVAAGIGAVQQRKAAKVQKKQNEVSNRIAANQRVRSVKRSIAAGRVRRGEIQAGGFAAGVAGGSAVAGATGGLSSDQASAQGASNQQFTGQVALTDLSNQITSLQSKAATAGAVGAVAGGLAANNGQQLEAVGGFFA
tara:strand:- start:9 stop:449 length:441 start_codon:yes stop_codon:yes gene_type:complete